MQHVFLKNGYAGGVPTTVKKMLEKSWSGVSEQMGIQPSGK